jgi:hypothetical protein
MKLDHLRRDLLGRVALALWGVVTLVLLFSVVLLVNHLIQQGDDPLSTLRTATGETPPPPPAASGASVATLGPRELPLYFAAPDGSSLVAARGTIEFTESTIENCRHALQALAAGPGEGYAPVLPPATTVRALYLIEGGELVVDFSRELLTAHAQMKSAGLEALLVYSVVQTLTQPALLTEGAAPIQRVRFLVEGAAPPESFPAHFDLSLPVAPDRRWVAGAEPGGHA